MMTDSQEREFWLQMITCIEAQAQVIQKHKLSPPEPGHIFDPGMVEPRAEKEFWQTWRRNLLSLVAVIKTRKIGGSAGVKLGKRRHRHRPQRLDKPPPERT
jgi:hypothetical protein